MILEVRSDAHLAVYNYYSPCLFPKRCLIQAEIHLIYTKIHHISLKPCQVNSEPSFLAGIPFIWVSLDSLSSNLNVSKDDFTDVPEGVFFFKNKIQPKDVVRLLDQIE